MYAYVYGGRFEISCLCLVNFFIKYYTFDNTYIEKKTAIVFCLFSHICKVMCDLVTGHRQMGTLEELSRKEKKRHASNKRVYCLLSAQSHQKTNLIWVQWPMTSKNFQQISLLYFLVSFKKNLLKCSKVFSTVFAAPDLNKMRLIL